MNILFINFEYPPLGGGGGVMTAQIAEELAKNNAVHVITTAFRGTKKYEFLHGVHVHRVAVIGRTAMPTATLISLLTFAPSAFFRGLQITRKHAFDVINAHFVIPSGLPALLLARIRKVPFVVTLVGGDIYDPSKGISPHKHALLRATIRYIISEADAVTAISQDTKQRAIELHGVKKRIDVIPIGLILNETPALPRESLGFTKQDFVCVSIGRLVPRKGYETLLTAWKDIANAKLIIIGDGPMKHDLEELIRRYELSDRVRLVGSVSEQEKYGILRASDLYVSTAQHEGFGIVFLEAMSAGLPIIAANDGGQKDFLEHGKHAILIPPHDCQAVIHAINELYTDEPLRKEMSRRNLEDVQNYTIDTTAGALEKKLLDTITAYEHRN